MNEWVEIISGIDNKKTNQYVWDTSNIPHSILLIKVEVIDNYGNIRCDIIPRPIIVNNINCPYISDVVITDATTGSFDYISNNHDIQILANFVGELSRKDITADLDIFSGFNNSEYPDYITNHKAVWLLRNIKCNHDDGPVNISISIKEQGNLGSNYGKTFIDTQNPEIFIYKPRSGIYVNDRILFSIGDLGLSLAIGKISVTVSLIESGGIKSVKWYLNENLVYTVDNKSNIFILEESEQIVNRIGIRVEDNAGNYKYDEIVILKI